MKLFAAFFLATLALATALPVAHHDHELQKFVEDVDDLLEFAYADDTGSELAEKLRESFNQILEKIREGIEKGKGLREELLNKLKDVREQMKERGVSLGERAKEILQKIREKGKEFWQKIMDRLNPSSHSDTGDEVADKLRESFNNILEKIREGIEKGKGLKEELLNKLKDVREKMKERGVTLGERAKEILQKIREKGKEFWQRIMDRLNPSSHSDTGDEVADKLRESFNNILEKIREGIEKGKGLKEELLNKLKDVRERMKERGVTLGERAKELLQKIREKGKEFWQRIMDRLNPSSAASEHDDIQKTVREAFEHVLEEIKEAVHKGKEVEAETIERLRGLYANLRAVKADISEKALETLEHIKEHARDFFNRVLADFGFTKRAGARSYDEIQTAAREAMEEVLEGIKEAVHKGEEVKPEIIIVVRQLYDYLRSVKADLNEKSLEILQYIKENARDFYDRVLADFRFNKRVAPQRPKSISDLYQKLKDFFKQLNIDLKEKFVKFGEWAKEKFEKGVELGKDRAENIKNLAKEFIADAKNITKDVAEDAKEFFREYKEDLGHIYDDLKLKIKEILDRQ